MVEVTNEEGTIEVSEEAQEELDYEKEFESQWGAGEEEIQEESEPAASKPSDEDESSGEDTGTQTPDPDEASSAPTEGEIEEKEEEPVTTDPDDPYSWINALPDEVREQASALKHRALSDQGRVAAYNRRLSDLQAEVDQMKTSRQSSPAAKAEEPSSAAPELPEKFKQLKEDFPEFADAVDAIREFDRQTYRDELNEKLQPLEEMTSRSRKTEFNQAVTAEADEIFNTQETGVHWQEVVQGEDFSAWLSQQPRSVQTAARTPDPVEAVYVLRQYENDYQRELAKLNSEQNEQAPVQKEEPTSVEADKIKERRTKRQKASVTPGSKPIVSDPNNEGGDYESEFDRQWG